MSQNTQKEGRTVDSLEARRGPWGESKESQGEKKKAWSFRPMDKMLEALGKGKAIPQPEFERK